jgi:hypothetical protein
MKDDKPSSIEAAVPHSTVETDMSTSANEPVAISQSNTPATPELIFSPTRSIFVSKLESLEAMVIHSDGRRHLIADIALLDRNKYQGRFREVLKECHMDSIEEIFDDNGCLNKWLVDSDFYRGSGCWGREMDKGSMAYLVLLTVRYLSLDTETWSLKFIEHGK